MDSLSLVSHKRSCCHFVIVLYTVGLWDNKQKILKQFNLKSKLIKKSPCGEIICIKWYDCIVSLKGELRSILTLSSFFYTFGVLSIQTKPTKIAVAYIVLSSF